MEYCAFVAASIYLLISCGFVLVVSFKFLLDIVLNLNPMYLKRMKTFCWWMLKWFMFNLFLEVITTILVSICSCLCAGKISIQLHVVADILLLSWSNLHMLWVGLIPHLQCAWQIFFLFVCLIESLRSFALHTFFLFLLRGSMILNIHISALPTLQ